ncbi:MAG TPA: hypothetical protein VGM37_15880 [Armatimonadota bacterium]|jgi:hypothetical protein
MTAVAACLALSLLLLCAPAHAEAFWTIEKDGGLAWTVAGHPIPHVDHIEMSGRKVSAIIHYGLDADGHLTLDRQVVWPTLRTIPNNTHASLQTGFGADAYPAVTADGAPLGPESPVSFRLRGLLAIASQTPSGIEVTRTLLPSTRLPALIENVTLRNRSGRAVTVEVPPFELSRRTDPEKGVDGAYRMEARSAGLPVTRLRPGRCAKFCVAYSGRREAEPALAPDGPAEQKAREAYVAGLWRKLRFECPDPVLERAFAFAKVRAAESIFDTKGGLMHGPGGGAYYAAIWANDQAEYANPFFPFLGDEAGNGSARNAFRLFGAYMTPEYKPVPSSIIAEGTDIWNGAGDRGDAAMIAYGASRYALASGDPKIAAEMWPIVQWCLEYCRRKTTADGVIASNCDELEGRFPAGDANLCTACLCYDAQRSAAFLARDLGQPESVSRDLNARADALAAAIERHFGAAVEGYPTYRYYAGNETLRAWIGIPLTMGIFTRSEGTVRALFSPRLWTENGLATEAGKETFWDRATLYALRGVFAAGDTERALDYLQKYSQRRLLGEHVPYPVEAWPEGNQRHLSAESALYARVITEGLFGIRPTGLRRFELTPRLPAGWNRMALRNVQAFGGSFDILVTRASGQPKVTVKPAHGAATVTAEPDGRYTVTLPE